MGKKIAINVFYNLGIIASVFGMIWAFNNKSPLIIAFFGATFAAFLYFKIQLIKDFRKGIKK
ncbi:DUF6358 family protein [Pedobacter sp. KR3-3]|uniref:DUF6358 family protein n=1 Tax=Pedobacter albus TaxID=3113905 RepID=A0ABU7IA20_9SPHI|nr:DUF6358 family protein [Pedobacter sp. KR3-3]MEE1946319.1 DUF6358 family protein [Pedobacter sp. KR3-3]